MLKFLFFFLFVLYLAFYVENPLLLSFFLVFFSTLVGAFLTYSLSLWAMNSIILVFLGGMMVIFLYVSTLSNGQKIVFLFSGLPLMISSLAFTSLPLLKPSHVIKVCNYSDSVMEFSLLFKLVNVSILVFLLCYLLLTLLSVVKLSESFKGSFMKMK